MSPNRTRQIERLELLHSIFPKSLVFAELAEAYREAGDFEAAYETVTAGLDQHPDYVEAYLVLARTLMGQGKDRRAMEALRQALELEPTHAGARASLDALESGAPMPEKRPAAAEAREATGAGGAGWEARWSYDAERRREMDAAPEPAAPSGAEASGQEERAVAVAAPPEMAERARAEPAQTSSIRDRLAAVAEWRPVEGPAQPRTAPTREVAPKSAPKPGVVRGEAPAALSKSEGGPPRRRSRRERPDQTLTPLADLLMGLLEYYDGYYRGGSSLTRLVAVGIAEEMGLEEPALSDIGLAAVLRDVGRLALGGRILSKRESDQHSQAGRGIEWHVHLGTQMLEGIALPRRVKLAVRHHHERWDGKGYPDGLVGERIPLEARVLAVADAFSAMIRPRPYRLPRRVPEAVAELHKEAGSQFDPAVVDAALRLMATNDLRGFGLGGRRHVIVVHPYGPDATVLAVKLGTAGFLAEVAADLKTAAERIRRVPVEALVLSGTLPPAEAASFIEQIRADTATHALPVLVVHADPPGSRVALLAAGADACIPGEAPFSHVAAMLAGIVGQSTRGRKERDGESGDVAWKALRGDLRDFGLSWLLQMMSYNGHTAAVIIERGDDKGIVYMVEGNPHHAETSSLAGERAMRTMLQWDSGHFAVAMDRRPPQRTIQGSLMHLLLDEAVASDHAAMGEVYGTVQAEPGASG